VSGRHREAPFSQRRKAIGAGLDADSKGSDLLELFFLKQAVEGIFTEHLIPPAMSIPFVAPLPIDVGFVPESAGKGF
jgi:hypothetical protein